MSSAPPAEEIWRNARWVAQALDPIADLIRFVELSPEAYRAESFLDDRILQRGSKSHLVKWAEVQATCPADVRTDARWIFHIGHVGSTLVSRLLGELDGVLAVREPRSLRDLTFFPREIRDKFVPGTRALMSRTFAKDEAAVIKATSMVSEIAAELAGTKAPALFLHTSAEVYLQTILAGDGSPAELQTLAAYYAQRAQRSGLPFQAEAEQPAQVAALVWACEMAALESAAERIPSDNLRWLDFDRFIEAPTEQLCDTAKFFGLSPKDDRIAEIVSGPLMNRYSKALEYQFGPDTRRQLLALAAQRHGASIATALAMLNRAAEKAPLLARALLRSTPDR